MVNKRRMTYKKPRPITVTVLGAAMAIATYSGYNFSQRSLDNIAPIDAGLKSVTECALNHSTHDFVVIEGLRSLERHKANLSAGKSWIGRSKHIDGFAVDVAAYDGGITWDFDPYREIAASFKYCSEKLSVPIISGIDWQVRDAGHFERADVEMKGGKWVLKDE